MRNTTLEERFAKLHNAVTDSEIYLDFSQPKVQRVPPSVRDRSRFASYYTPRMISIGPIHHHLQLGQQYKLIWTKMHLEDTKQRAEYLHKKIENKIMELREIFATDAIGNYHNDDLAWMLFVDGCSVLHILNNADLNDPERLKLKGDQLPLVITDLLLLENQLPYRLLLLLSSHDENLIYIVNRFLRLNVQFEEKEPVVASNIDLLAPHSHQLDHHIIKIDDPDPLNHPNHLLDHLHRNLLYYDGGPELDDILVSIQKKCRQSILDYPINRSIQELKRAGIHVKRNEKAWGLIDIEFTRNFFKGALLLPRLILTEEMTHILLNLTAYEMCPDFQNVSWSLLTYLNFLNSLIHSQNDVKELREAGVLHNPFASDQVLLHLFRTICADLVPISSSMAIYTDIRSAIDDFYNTVMARARNKCRIWVIEAYTTYFRSPWTILAFLGALVGLLLTAIQTWYTIYHK